MTKDWSMHVMPGLRAIPHRFGQFLAEKKCYTSTTLLIRQTRLVLSIFYIWR